MNRDPFYRQIEEALAGPLDAEQFEQCAVDLLRPTYPTLVPIRGGHDGGRDGEAANVDGNRLFLVTTIGDPAVNLRKNLRSHRDSGRAGRLCLLATRRVLNADARSKLEKSAEREGYQLVRIHDGADFADRLYQSPPWSRALLQLTGSPPALSTLPITQRPLIQVELVGRESDLEWLRNQDGDALLVGQPGSGKTFLLLTWARLNNALFVRTNDLTLVAEGLRAQRPSALIVDDAHLNPNFVAALRQMRADLGADFRILANTWPGDADVLRRNLDLTSEGIRTLELLTRSQIVDVIKHAGIIGPTDLVREIVTQAHGRPGLAVTLTQLCLRRGTRELVLGDELAREVSTTFGKLIGEQAIPLLATFALGGKTGMRPKDVAASLNLSLLELQTKVARLASGGVLEQRRDCLRVLPAPLRFALVRDVFLSEPATLPLHTLLGLAPDADDATRVLIFAKGRGATLPPDLLRTRVLESRTVDLWSMFASLGEAEARWVLEQAPAGLLQIADAGLATAPRQYLQFLLTAATLGPDHDLERRSHPLRTVRNWVRSAFPASGEALVRRRRLAEAAERWLDAGGDYLIGMRAWCLALDPSFEANETDPGCGNTFTFRYGLLSVEELSCLAGEWPRVLRRLDWTRVRSWKFLSDTVSEWITPRWIKPQAAVYGAARESGWDMLCALADTAPENWSVQRWAKQYAQRLRKSRRFALPRDVETLFPTRDYATGEETISRRDRASEMLAAQWAKRPPEEVAERWKAIVSAVEAGGVDTWGESMGFARRLAPRVPESRLIAWAVALKAAAIPPDYVAPLWERIAAERPDGWEDVITDALSDSATSPSALYASLPQAELPTRIEELIAQEIVKHPRVVGLACLRGRVPQNRLFVLLTHSDPLVVAETAKNMWMARPQRMIPEGLRAPWEDAVVKHLTGEESSLVSICEKETDLGLRWLRARLETNSLKVFYGPSSPAEVVARRLDKSARLELVGLVRESYFQDDFVAALIGGDPEVYTALLRRPGIEHLHSVALRGRPSPEWAVLARAALEAGWEPERIVHAAWSGPGGWSGSEAKHWEEWENAFVKLGDFAPDLAELSEFGASLFRERKELCERSERRQAIFNE